VKRQIVLLAVVAALDTLDTPKSAFADQWRVHQGAWFSINYPPGFKARPGMKSATRIPGYDSAFFTAPDKTVEFYVYSPQWSGQPKDIEMNPKSEVYVSQKTENKGGQKVRWVTIKAKNGEYYRSFVDTVDTSSGSELRKTFGIKYRDQKSYNRYRSDYLKFKKSLGQLAD